MVVKIAIRMDWLYGLQMNGIKLGLDNITELLRRMDDPQKDFPVIHVAGSDGKGSTCAILASVLRAAGFRVGLYTSPHVIDFRERIQVDGEPVSEKETDHLIGCVRHFVGDMRESGFSCTYFEVVTAMAFRYFRDQKVDVAVIEVGMGGRFDATNVVDPLVSVINNISLEHTQYLGDTIEKIAFEKAGIIKSGRPVVTMNSGPALEVIRRVAEEKGAPLTVVDAESVNVVKSGRTGVLFDFGRGQHCVSIPGRYEARNAALAIRALEQLPFADKVLPHVDEGLTSVRWPCRMELFPNDVIVDVSHTAAGVKGLVRDVEEVYGKVVLVFGILSDKSVDEVCGLLAGVSSKVVVTAPDCERANPLEDTLAHMVRYFPGAQSAPTISEAIDKAVEIRDEGEVILVTGSFYMAEGALRWMGRTSL